MNNFSNHLPFLSTHLSDIQDELIGRQRDMEVMEQRLEEYSAIIRTQEDTIGSMTTPTIAKQWVKNKDKKGMHMEWTVQCNKLVIELLANRVPPTPRSK